MADPDDEKANQQVGPEKPTPDDSSADTDGKGTSNDDSDSRAAKDDDKF